MGQATFPTERRLGLAVREEEGEWEWDGERYADGESARPSEDAVAASWGWEREEDEVG